MTEAEPPKDSASVPPETREPTTEESAPAGRAAPGPAPEDWGNRYLYLLAEFENYRKRVERERDLTRRETRGLLLRQLLPLHDALIRAQDAARELPTDDHFRKGVELLFREWERFLAGERFQPVARIGEPFRPEEEEAVGEVPAPPGARDGSVAEVVQQGYRTPGGLLRPAKVLIARVRLPAELAGASAAAHAGVAPSSDRED